MPWAEYEVPEGQRQISASALLSCSACPFYVTAAQVVAEERADMLLRGPPGGMPLPLTGL